jgi:hypothetical protein
METFKLVGILSAMILMIVAGAGFEFAHTVGTHDEAMVLSIQEQESSPSGKIDGRGHTTE